MNGRTERGSAVGARTARLLVGGAALLALAIVGGCPSSPLGGGGAGFGTTGVFNNTTDPTNGSSTYIGSAACIACHSVVTPDIANSFRIHGHPHILSHIEGAAPTFPAEADRAGVPSPPAGKQWADVSYVVGGYLKAARFVNQAGYVMTDAGESVPTVWDLALPATGAQAGFAASDPSETTPLAYSFDNCFRCHATGAQPQDPANPHFQDSRPGMAGTWIEAGVQCEACHGPGSNHAPNPSARVQYVNSAATACGQCHAHGPDPGTILATSDGFVAHDQQWSELLASGGHKAFACTVCHDPHVSVNYAEGLRNQCTDCHKDKTLGFHTGKVFARGDYTEPLECQSCHMPFAARAGSAAPAAAVGPYAHVGDTRTHIFRINVANVNYTEMLSADGKEVLKDADGKAAVTLDFVCLRCHNDVGNTFLLTVKGAAGIAQSIHKPVP